MQALALTASGPSLQERPEPQPGPGELLIRVCAAGVITTETQWDPTLHRKTGEPRTDPILGHEFSGVVAAVGSNVSDFAAGQEVYGMNDWYAEGATAGYCTAPYLSVALKPRRATHIEAAAAPISALTAIQGLFDRAGLKAGESVLVHGGAGGVGTWAIQLARLHGAHVIATASAANAEFVRNLAADEVIDYRAGNFENSVRKVDMVFDTVGGDTLERSFRILAPGGRIVTIVSPPAGPVDPRVKAAFFIVEPNRRQLAEVAALLDDGQVRSVVDSVVPLSEAPGVYAGKIRRQGRGKVVVSIAAN
jgi:NADPH:quinone reductase-like Zn-dependent oxidoreductase